MCLTVQQTVHGVRSPDATHKTRARTEQAPCFGVLPTDILALLLLHPSAIIFLPEKHQSPR